MNARRVINESTLIPISLVFTLLGVAAGSATIYSKTERHEQELAAANARFDKSDERFSEIRAELASINAKLDLVLKRRSQKD